MSGHLYPIVQDALHYRERSTLARTAASRERAATAHRLALRTMKPAALRQYNEAINGDQLP